MVFLSKENENFLRQHCFPFQYAPLCTIWDHLNKLCHECGHKIDHLAWKPWIFTHHNSFLRTFFKNKMLDHLSYLLDLENWKKNETNEKPSHHVIKCDLVFRIKNNKIVIRNFSFSLHGKFIFHFLSAWNEFFLWRNYQIIVAKLDQIIFLKY